MKIRIAVIIALGSILPIQSSFSDTVDATKVKTFVAGQAAVAAEVNGNFTETTRAVNDNFVQIDAHKNDAAAHGGGGVTISSASIGGDGSGKTLSIANNLDWSGRRPDGTTKSPQNLNWSSCSFTGAITIIIPSGVTMRCKTGFVLGAAATIVVKQGYGIGIATEQPTSGVVGTAGFGGMPAEEAVIRSSTNGIPFGGAGFTSGGYLRIQSDGEISIQGTIIADGSIGTVGSRAGGGGGAGGIIVLQSTQNIILSGTIQANGGNGADGKLLNATGGGTMGPSGGGGGGIVVMHAPDIKVPSATINVKAGVLGGGLPVIPTPIRFGDGGYASGGKGGAGKDFETRFPRLPGGVGLVIQITGNPATMVP